MYAYGLRNNRLFLFCTAERLKANERKFVRCFVRFVRLRDEHSLSVRRENGRVLHVVATRLYATQRQWWRRKGKDRT